MMQARQFYSTLQRAMKSDPVARRASVWTLATDSEGRGIVLPSGSFLFQQLCLAWVTFDFRKDGQFEGITGDFDGAFRLTILPDAVMLNPLVLPHLGQAFYVKRFPSFIGDPTPEIIFAMTKAGGDAMGLLQTFDAREPDPTDVDPAIWEAVP